MHDAAGQLAEGRHPLRAQQFAFNCFQMSDVRVGDQNALGIPGLISFERHMALDENNVAFLCDLSQLAGPIAVLAQHAIKTGREALVQKVVDVLADRFLSSPTIETLCALVPKPDAIVEVADDERILREVE